MDFVKQYNAATESQVGTIIPVEITVFEDRSFTFITKTPPAAVLIKEALNLEKGSAVAIDGNWAISPARPERMSVASSGR